MNPVRTPCTLSVAALVILVLGATSCGGPSGPRPGTPEFYWQAAKETFDAGDYVKTNEHLGRVADSSSDLARMAQEWRMVLTSGMAKAYIHMANQYESGSRVNKDNPTPFRVQMGDFRSQADRLTVQFAETFLKYNRAGHQGPVIFAFGFPKGSAAPVAELDQPAKGILLDQGALAVAQKRAIDRGVLLATCAAAGAPEDPARTLEMFKPGQVEVPQPQFLLAMATALYDTAQLYTRSKMNNPDKLKIMTQNAVKTVEKLPDGDDKKKLAEDLQKLIKQENISS
jgi:hypothetical protein